jgi:hypothetical protein
MNTSNQVELKVEVDPIRWTINSEYEEPRVMCKTANTWLHRTWAPQPQITEVVNGPAERIRN